MPTQETPSGMSPTDLGKPYGLAPRQVNEILAGAQLQMHRPGQSGWVPTPTGATFVFEYPPDGAKPILWLPSVNDFITAAINPVIRFVDTQCYPYRYARTPLPYLWQAYEKWSASEDVGRPLAPSIFETLVASLGAKCYPSPNGRIAVDLALIEDAPEQTRREAAQQQAALNQIGQFIETQCRPSATTRTPAVVFYDAYKDWLRSENNGCPVGRKEFFERLDYYGYSRQRDTRGVRILIGLQLIGRRPRLKIV